MVALRTGGGTLSVGGESVREAKQLRLRRAQGAKERSAENIIRDLDIVMDISFVSRFARRLAAPS